MRKTASGDARGHFECKTCASRVQIEGKASLSQKMISAEERAERVAAARFGFANVELEGFTISPETKARVQLWVDGQIEFADLLGDEPEQP